LGSGLAQFGERFCSVWGAALLSLGSGSAQFGERIFCWNFSQVSDNNRFVKPGNDPNFLDFVFNKNNNNKWGVVFLKV
jgi:hypothetical protein